MAITSGTQRHSANSKLIVRRGLPELRTAQPEAVGEHGRSLAGRVWTLDLLGGRAYSGPVSTDMKLPAGSLNQAIDGPGFWSPERTIPLASARGPGPPSERSNFTPRPASSSTAWSMSSTWKLRTV